MLFNYYLNGENLKFIEKLKLKILHKKIKNSGELNYEKRRNLGFS